MKTKKTTETKNALSGKYFEAVGRRKSAVARVRLFEKKSGKAGLPDGQASITINDKECSVYFPVVELQEIVKSPLKKTRTEAGLYVSGKVNGGGIKSQADAMKLGISRALLKFSPEFRRILKSDGFLTRDARVVERKKFGLKKARKAPQWSKR